MDSGAKATAAAENVPETTNIVTNVPTNNGANMMNTNVEETTTEAAKNVEETTTAEEASAGLANEYAVNQPTTTKGKPVRSEKQKEADAGQAKMLERIRKLYSEEFADIPERSRPKAKAWVARAAYYKPTEDEREEYITKMMKADRDSLSETGSVNMTVNNASNAPTNKNAKNAVRSMVARLQGTLDTAVENAVISVEGAATTSETRRAAKKFVTTLRSSTRKLKSSLAKEIGNSGNSGNSGNNTASTNENSPYKTRGRSVPISNNSGMIPENSLANAASAPASALNNSLNYNSVTTIPSEENSESVNSAPNANSSVNINLSKMRMNSPVASSNSNNANNRSYNRLTKAVGSTKKRRRPVVANYNSVGNFASNSSSNSASNSASNSPRRKLTKRARTTPVSNYTEL